jgi:glycosyltransferase involved in cell wall biosynthesis
MSKLVIISHTNHQMQEDGYPVGWAPTINEINYLAQFFDEVVHVACLSNAKPSGSSIPYTDPKIKLYTIAPFGGRSLRKKIGILFNIAAVINSVNAALIGASHVQIRVPMGIGLYLLPYFMFIKNNRNYILWVKFANNWIQKKPPISYALQRWFLKKDFLNCKVTINGSWENQEKHCVSFENPCLKFEQVKIGKEIAHSKFFKIPYKLVFVGRLEKAKGVERILKALSVIPLNLISNVTFIGEGPDLPKYVKESTHLIHKIIFLGAISQIDVHRILSESDFLLLPTTASEGFPKVVAEASCFGCIPICTNLASIGQYVKHNQSGFLIEESEVDNLFPEFLLYCLSRSKEQLNYMAINANK